MNKITSFYLAGLSFRPPEVEEKLGRNIIVKLASEPDNPYDENAIKILLFDDTHIGYVPKKQTQELHPYRICGIPVYSIIANYVPETRVDKRVLITVQSEIPLPKFIPTKEEELFNDFINLDKLVDE